MKTLLLRLLAHTATMVKLYTVQAILCARKHAFTTPCCALLVCTILPLAGCRSMARPQVEDVVQSRQLSLSGLDAMHRGEWGDAEKYFTEAIEKSATNQRARCCFAEALWRRGATDDAIKQMQEAVRLSGGDPNLRIRLGEMYLSRGDLDAAAIQADESIRQNPRLASSWALQGDLWARRAQPGQALASYHRAVSYQPHFPRVQLAMARLYRETRQPERALVALQTLAEAYRPSEVPAEVFELEGLACKDLSRHDDAANLLARAIELGADHPQIYYQLGEAYMLANRPNAARLTLLAGLQKHPHHRLCRDLLARVPMDRTVIAARDDARRGR